jgi:carotenoid cleavage dioxygenase-like enzyme
MFNFGVSFSATQPMLNVYRFGAQAQLLYCRRLRLDYPCSVHDFSLSPSYAIFYLSPYNLDMEALIQQNRTLMDALRWEPEHGSRLLIVSRDSGDEAATISISQRYCLHLINCFETGHRLMVDVVEYDRPLYDQYQVVPDFFTEVSAGQPVRFVVDMKSREVIERQDIDYGLAPDFPSIDPMRVTQAYRDVWMLGMSATGRRGRKFFDQLIHADWEEATTGDVYQAPPMQYLGGEPICIGDPGDQRTGSIICQVFDAAHMTSAFALFDVFHVAGGPVAMLPLREPIPSLFHASFRRGE